LTSTLQETTRVKIVGTADTESAGIELLGRPGTWQLAIVDLFLKQGSGLNVVASCSNRHPNQKVIVLTNYATAHVRKQCLELRADEVFDKSTELDNLIEYCRGLSSSPISL
jgi:two-component system, OmpR family, response regulator